MKNKIDEDFENWFDSERGRILPYDENYVISASEKEFFEWERQAFHAGVKSQNKEIEKLKNQNEIMLENLIKISEDEDNFFKYIANETIEKIQGKDKWVIQHKAENEK
jgi:hypothetical protein